MGHAPFGPTIKLVIFQQLNEFNSKKGLRFAPFWCHRQAKKTKIVQKTLSLIAIAGDQGNFSMTNIKNGNFFWTILRLPRNLHKTVCIRELTTGVTIEIYRNITP